MNNDWLNFNTQYIIPLYLVVELQLPIGKILCDIISAQSITIAQHVHMSKAYMSG